MLLVALIPKILESNLGCKTTMPSEEKSKEPIKNVDFWTPWPLARALGVSAEPLHARGVPGALGGPSCLLGNNFCLHHPIGDCGWSVSCVLMWPIWPRTRLWGPDNYCMLKLRNSSGWGLISSGHNEKCPDVRVRVVYKRRSLWTIDDMGDSNGIVMCLRPPNGCVYVQRTNFPTITSGLKPF